MEDRFTVSNEARAAIVRAAILAPTGDNSQHWDFLWENDRLLVFYVPEKAKHVLNDHNYASLLSLGGVIESISISASHFGIESFFDYCMDKEGSNLWLRVGFKEAPNKEPDLYMDLENRHADRRKFINDKLPESLLKTFKKLGEELKVKVHIFKNDNPKLRNYLENSEKYIWNNRQVYLDTLKWVRFSKKEVLETRDGMSLANVGVKEFEAPALKALAFSKVLWHLILNTGMKVKVFFDTRAVYKSSPYFLFFSVDKFDRLDYVRVGRVMFRAWVILNKHSYGVQPMSIACLLPNILREKGELQNCNAFYEEQFRNSHALFESTLGLDEGERVVWGLRTGLTSRLPDDARTTRRFKRS